MLKLIQIHPNDTVAVALEPLARGETVPLGAEPLTLSADVPAGYKIALRAIAKGEEVLKYGSPIGRASADIARGEAVHAHNLKTGLGELLEYTYSPAFAPLPARAPGTFQGFRRLEGGVGIRNELWIIPTVGCVNSVAQNLAAAAASLAQGSVEGVYAFSHPYGCSQLGEDHENTKKALCGLIRHPNAGGVLVLGLGCENNHIAGMREMLGEYDPRRVKFLCCQDSGDEMADGLALLGELASFAKGFAREPVSMSELTVGLKCGGSDGLSGITANPVVGVFSDRLIAEGGTALLTEVPEMFGAETRLMDRCVNAQVFDKTVRLINGFKEYFMRHGQEIYENPSPGNKAGGITTLEDKSLGCTQKCGAAPVSDVLDYGESVHVRGLNLLQGPGNDLVASSAEAISGAHLVLFTTGRGTPFGSPVPTVKIASNTPLAERKRGWIDFDAGRLLAGIAMDTLADELYEYVRALASGELRTKTEQNGIRDVAIFKDGVTL